MNAIAIIPARYSSSRFMGKPLAMIGDKTMIHRVYSQCLQCDLLSDVVVATDDERIFDHVLSFGGKAIMTSPAIDNGSKRCLCAYEIWEKETGQKADVLVNVQGDEPFIAPEAIRSLVDSFSNPQVQIATLIKKIEDKDFLFDPNVVKVVRSVNGWALYFSRQALPYCRDLEPHLWLEHLDYFKHIGIYAFAPKVLKELMQLAVGRYEESEKLEQLRWLENDFRVFAVETKYESLSVDTPEDLLKIKNKI